MTVITRNCIVSGRVQGVFFRAETRAKARALGLSGWVRNLPDGRVEVRARGAEAAVEALCAWLWKGPPSARVDAVDCRESAAGAGGEFEIA